MSPRSRSTGLLEAYLAECRERVLVEIRGLIPADHPQRRALYDLMLDYPLRAAKALRPALCVAACRALGGHLEAVLRSAAVIELYHNAFLIHDDIEDLSQLRRGGPTLHSEHGVPIAINVGDAMLALSLRPLLDNTRLLGLGKAIRILQAIATMVQESVEGQAIELDWVQRGTWELDDADYITMVVKKTGWYSFITPVLVGGIAADADPARLDPLRAYADDLGVAFQIQDDLLNLEGDVGEYGKEAHGDLWEGKRTLILLHALRAAAPAERAAALATLRRPRPVLEDTSEAARLGPVVDALLRDGELSPAGAERLRRALEGRPGGAPEPKRPEEVAALLDLIRRHRSLDHARGVARRHVLAARAHLDAADLPPSTHRDFLYALIDYVLDRDR